MFIMAIIYKFVPKKKSKKTYSQHFIEKVSARKVSKYLLEQNRNLTQDVADSMALAIISSTHLQLLLEEKGITVPHDTLDEFQHIDFLDHESETIH